MYIKRPRLKRQFWMFWFRMVGTRNERLWTIRIPNVFGIRAPTELFFQCWDRDSKKVVIIVSGSSNFTIFIYVMKSTCPHLTQINTEQGWFTYVSKKFFVRSVLCRAIRSFNLIQRAWENNSWINHFACLWAYVRKLETSLTQDKGPL